MNENAQEQGRQPLTGEQVAEIRASYPQSTLEQPVPQVALDDISELCESHERLRAEAERLTKERDEALSAFSGLKRVLEIALRSPPPEGR